MDPKNLLFVGLTFAVLLYVVVVVVRGGLVVPTPLQLLVGFVTAFFDTLGIGSFATTTVVFKLRRMVPVKLINPDRDGDPIMVGSCAFLMPVSSMRFIGARTYDPQTSIGVALGDVPAVLIAAFVVVSLLLAAVRWLVVTVVLYTSANMLLTVDPDER